MAAAAAAAVVVVVMMMNKLSFLTSKAKPFLIKSLTFTVYLPIFIPSRNLEVQS